MDAGDLFLSCSNLTLGQYRMIVLTRGLTGAAGCVISLAVLGTILLTIKKRAWESWPKRIYLATVKSLHLALFHNGYSSSELLTPSFPGINMV